MKVKISTIHAIFVYFLVFFSTTYISYNPIRYVLLVLVAIMLAPNIKAFILKSDHVVNSSMIAFCMVTLILSYMNRNDYRERNPFLAAIVFVAALIEFMFTVELFSEKKMMQHLISVFYRLTFLIVIVNDLLILFTNIHLKFGGDVFLVGTKFSVAYMHFYLIAFYFADKNIKFLGMTRKSFNKKISLFVLFFIAIAMSIKLETATGIVGTVAFLAFLWISEMKLNWLLNSKSFLVALSFSVLFAVFIDLFLSNQLVIYVITQLLGKDVTLTFRTIIYAMFPTIMKNHWLLGFGYGTGYEVLMKYGIVDAQNGLFDWVQQVGILGTVALSIWLCILMSKPSKEYIVNSSGIKSLTAIVYVFIFLATVEITFSLEFIAIIILLYGLKKQTEQEQREWVEDDMEENN